MADRLTASVVSAALKDEESIHSAPRRAGMRFGVYCNLAMAFAKEQLCTVCP